MSLRPNRRQFVLAAAATTVGVGAFALARTRGAVPVTGAADSRLAAFDRLMTAVIRGVPVPGAALAVTRHGRLVYARGFGYADARRCVPVQPAALFRIASVSKPITAVAVLRLVDQGKLNLDDPVLKYVRIEPHRAPGAMFDSRLHAVTVRHCLQHTGGWDRDISPDPSGIPWDIADALGSSPPLTIDDVVRYGLGRRLDFDPGTRHVYSNFGYLLLGRVIEAGSGDSYEDYVRREVLTPLGVGQMRLGRALPEDRFLDEVHYHDTRRRFGRCLHPPRLRAAVPLPDGADNFEVYEAHGGWVASAIDLVRFAHGFDDPEHCPVLSAKAIETMWQRPAGDVESDRYYACGWRVRPAGTGGRPNTWHAGTVWGASALLVRRGDGVSWAVLFNTDSHPNGTKLPELVDGYLHDAADEVSEWPAGSTEPQR